MKLIIAGSRTLNPSYSEILNYVFNLDLDVTEVVSGTANGVDKAGETFVKIYNSDAEFILSGNFTPIKLKQFPADWKQFGKAAGHIRNKQMADYADALLLIWTGDRKNSPGSYSMKQYMLKLNKPIYEVIIKVEPNE